MCIYKFIIDYNAVCQNKQLTMSSQHLSNPAKRKLEDPSSSRARREDIKPNQSTKSNPIRFQDPSQGGDSDPPAKRFKTTSAADMSRVQQRGGSGRSFNGFAASEYKRPSGAKVLAVTNLRKKPKTDSHDHYERTWKLLEACITDVFAGHQLQQSLEKLYNGVEDICREGSADRLFRNLKDRCEVHLTKGVLPTFQVHSRSTNLDLLRHVYGCWQEFHNQMVVLKPHISRECQN